MRNLHLLTALLLFITLSSFRIDKDKDLFSTYTELQTIITNYSIPDSDTDEKISDLKEHIQKVESQLDKIIKMGLQQVSKDFLTLDAQIHLVQLNETLVILQNPKWDDVSLSELKNTLYNKLILWRKRNRTATNTSKKLSKLKAKERAVVAKVLDIQKLDIDKFKKIWPAWKNKVDHVIQSTEDFLYDRKTFNKSFVQLEEFISWGKYDDKFTHSRRHEAFQDLYKLYTKDGEPSTIEQFKDFITSKEMESWQELLDKLMQSEGYQSDLKEAYLAHPRVNSDFFEPKSLEKVIEKMAPKEIAFVALQKRIAVLLNSRNYDAAYDIVVQYQPLFTNQPMYMDMDKKYKNLIYEIERAKKGHIKSVRALPHMNNPKIDELTISINNEKKHMCILDAQSEENKIFKRGKDDSWEPHSIVEHNGSDVYYFTKNVIKNGIDHLEHQSRANFYAHQSIKKLFSSSSDVYNTDISISWRYNIAFFVSSSPYERRLMNEDNTEYQSPGNINNIFTSQFHHKSPGYHGRVHGNINTDIYYTTTDDNGNSWSKPVHLGSIINSPYSERSPIISEDGNTLYFSSEGLGGFGGFDAFEVSIAIVGGKVKINGEPKHITSIASPYDELFYQVINERTPSQEIYFSSNRNDNFDIYTVVKEEKPVPTEGFRSDSPVEKQFLPEWPGKHLLLDLHCDSFENVQHITKPGFIVVRGRIYDSKERLVKEAVISFYHKDYRGDIQKIQPDDKGKYSVQLKDNRRYKITITAKTVDGNTVTEYLDKFIDVCANPTSDSYQHQDLQTEEIKKLQSENAFTGFDFFFETNKFESTISNLQILEEHYSVHFRLLKEVPGIKFKLEAYADERGSEIMNLQLANNRLNTTLRFFNQYGFNPSELDGTAIGETTMFDNDDIPSLTSLLPNYIFNFSTQEKKWLMNRRVLIKFTH